MFYYLLAVVLELIVLAFILRSAWTWPRISTTAAELAVTADPRHRARA